MVRNIQRAVICHIYLIAQGQEMSEKALTNIQTWLIFSEVINEEYKEQSNMYRQHFKDLQCNTVQNPTPNGQLHDMRETGTHQKLKDHHPHQTDGSYHHQVITINRNHHEASHSLDVVFMLFLVIWG